MIRLVDENLFDAKTNIIAHGVNCQGKMNSGVAKQIRTLFPKAYSDYITKYEREGWYLGDIQLVPVGKNPQFIANLATQDCYGYDRKQYADYGAVQACISKLFAFASKEGFSVAMPEIGCGLGGLEWSKVFVIINKTAMQYPDLQITVYRLGEKKND